MLEPVKSEIMSLLSVCSCVCHVSICHSSLCSTVLADGTCISWNTFGNFKPAFNVEAGLRSSIMLLARTNKMS